VDAVNALVVTVSDRASRGEMEDQSGPAAVTALAALGFTAVIQVVPDGIESVRTALEAGVAADVPLIITTGGTGPAPRDLTPEATALVVDRRLPGIPEAMRAATFGVRMHGMLSRGVAGIARRTIIINLPGSSSGVVESLAVVGGALRHAVELLRDLPSGHNDGA
jgi:molybdenum cofactor biosynthesis protein B